MTDFLDTCYRTIRHQETLLSEIARKDGEEGLRLILGKRNIVLTGCGDSYAVAQLGFWALESLGVRCLAVSPSELRRVHIDCDTLVIGVSASGRSLETIAGLKDARSRGAITVALTDTTRGPLVDVVDLVWLTQSGVKSYNTTPSATTTAAMAHLLRIAASHPSSGVRTGEDLLRLSSISRQTVDWAEERGREIAGMMLPPAPVYFISEGPNYVTAQLGAMKFNETSTFKAAPVVREEFRHHYNLSIETGDHAVLLTDLPPNPDDWAYLDVLSKLGMRTYHLWTPTELGIITPLVQTIPNTIALQMAAYHTVLRFRPEMKGFKEPHASAFKIY